MGVDGEEESKRLGYKTVSFFFYTVYGIMGLAGIAESLCCCKLKWF